MKSFKNLAVSALLMGIVAIAALPSAGQIDTAPIVVKQTRPKPVKSVWLKAEVIHADRASVVVREQNNPIMIHTFTYSTQLKAKMETLADRGGFQPGDKVKILCQPGQSVALKLHGKPSKPL